MITGIQITKAANDDLLNSFLAAGQRKRRSALHRLQKQVYAEDEVVAVSKTG
ncbi:autonomous glycyl radical cofactor [Escherichia coli]|nr:autonomous glycyl radical cofactor [Escherichia coli]